MSHPLSILFEDNHLLVVNKPAGVATIGVANDEASIAKLAKEYLQRKYNKPGNVYLGVMSRLDAFVSGVLLLARTSKAAARLTEQFRQRTVEKTYWAVVEGVVEPTSATWTDWLIKDEQAHRMRAVASSVDGAQEARLSYRRTKMLNDSSTSLVEIDLLTGRKHQIRVQFSSRGWPVLGDRKYGARQTFAIGIALHARRLVIDHPVSKERLQFVAPLPASWRSFGITDSINSDEPRSHGDAENKN